MVLSVNSGTPPSSICHAGEALAIDLRPVAFRHDLQGKTVVLHRSDQPHAALDLAVVEHEARRWDLNGGSAGALVDEQDGARVGKAGKSVIERDRAVAPPLGDGEQPRLRAGAGMSVDRAPVGDDKALGA
jgi:hypothetical protein